MDDNANVNMRGTGASGAGRQSGERRFCPYCGKELRNPGLAFCPYCGNKLSDSTKGGQGTINVKDIADKAVGTASDIISKTSTSVSAAATRFKNLDAQKRKLILIIASLIVVAFVALIIVLNIHRCPECGEMFFGRYRTVSIFGEKYKMCKDCYNGGLLW